MDVVDSMEWGVADMVQGIKVRRCGWELVSKDWCGGRIVLGGLGGVMSRMKWMG